MNAGTMSSVINRNCDCVGKDNLTQMAGIQGFPTAGREGSQGLPNSVAITGYTGFSTPFGGTVPTLVATTAGGRASLNLIRGAHTINIGYQFHHLTTFARHSSGVMHGAPSPLMANILETHLPTTCWAWCRAPCATHLCRPSGRKTPRTRRHTSRIIGKLPAISRSTSVCVSTIGTRRYFAR